MLKMLNLMEAIMKGVIKDGMVAYIIPERHLKDDQFKRYFSTGAYYKTSSMCYNHSNPNPKPAILTSKIIGQLQAGYNQFHNSDLANGTKFHNSQTWVWRAEDFYVFYDAVATQTPKPVYQVIKRNKDTGLLENKVLTFDKGIAEAALIKGPEHENEELHSLTFNLYEHATRYGIQNDEAAKELWE